MWPVVQLQQHSTIEQSGSTKKVKEQVRPWKSLTTPPTMMTTSASNLATVKTTWILFARVALLTLMAPSITAEDSRQVFNDLTSYRKFIVGHHTHARKTTVAKSLLMTSGATPQPSRKKRAIRYSASVNAIAAICPVQGLPFLWTSKIFVLIDGGKQKIWN